MTAGTLFDRTRTPLTVWFTACWSFATAKDEIAALSLQRSLEIGSYQTAWAMLDRFRSVLVQPGRKRLTARWRWMKPSSAAKSLGWLEACSGQEGPDRDRGRSPPAQGDQPVPDGAARRRVGRVMLPFVSDHVAPAATVITDGWMGYHGLASSATPIGGAASGLRGPMARTRRAAARRAPRRFAGQAVAAEHSPGRGRARPPAELPRSVRVPLQPPALAQRGMVFYRVLELAAGHEPVRYRNITAGNKPRKTSPVPPATRGHPPSLDRVTAGRPWRAAYLPYSG